MLRNFKLATLRALKTSGVFDLVAASRWRQNRLLILCYHGTALEDEHQWRPALYVDPRVLEQRLEMLKQGGYAVLALGEGLQRLQAGTLPPRSVAITFDDGTYDFYRRAYPLLKQYGLRGAGLPDYLLHGSSAAGVQPDLLLHAVEAAWRGDS